jgi:hypothetical protein
MVVNAMSAPDSDTALKPLLMTHPGPTFADAGCELLVVSVISDTA